jgi:undecaprenyl diphosphate synthase
MNHLAIILDGNRRWARERSLPTFEGHRRGYDNVKTIGLAALERGVEFFTVFAFSTENWKRSEEEVGYLMDLLVRALTKDLDFFLENGVRLKVIGRRNGLSQKVLKAIDQAEEKTADGRRGQINLCINYGGRAEIIDGVKQLIKSGDEVTEENLTRAVWTHGIPDPDMIVRTSGEHRLSGFLTWSGVYSELKIVDSYWPDFSVDDLKECLSEYEERQRRFGK